MAKTKKLEPELEQIARRIKSLRVKKGFTSAENFAYENEFNRVQYWRTEKGANFTMRTLIRILKIHKITLDEFFKGMK